MPTSLIDSVSHRLGSKRHQGLIFSHFQGTHSTQGTSESDNSQLSTQTFSAHFQLELICVVIDAYSRCPEVDIVRPTAASATIRKPNSILSTHDIPYK